MTWNRLVVLLVAVAIAFVAGCGEEPSNPLDPMDDTPPALAQIGDGGEDGVVWVGEPARLLFEVPEQQQDVRLHASAVWAANVTEAGELQPPIETLRDTMYLPTDGRLDMAYRSGHDEGYLRFRLRWVDSAGNEQLDSLIARIDAVVPEVGFDLVSSRVVPGSAESVTEILLPLPGEMLVTMSDWYRENDGPVQFQSDTLMPHAGISGVSFSDSTTGDSLRLPLTRLSAAERDSLVNEGVLQTAENIIVLRAEFAETDTAELARMTSVTVTVADRAMNARSLAGTLAWDREDPVVSTPATSKENGVYTLTATVSDDQPDWLKQSGRVEVDFLRRNQDGTQGATVDSTTYQLARDDRDTRLTVTESGTDSVRVEMKHALAVADTVLARMTVFDGAGRSVPTTSSSLTGTGETGNASVSPETRDFGWVTADTTMPFTVTNSSGDGSLVIGSVETGDPSLEVTPTGGIIQPDETLDFNVTWHPAEPGSLSAEIALFDGAGEEIGSVAAVGFRSPLAVADDQGTSVLGGTLSLGETAPGGSASNTLTLIRPADAPGPVTIDRIYAGDENGLLSEHFTAYLFEGGTLDAGDTARVRVLYTPQSAGDYTTQLYIELAGGFSFSAVELTGTVSSITVTTPAQSWTIGDTVSVAWNATDVTGDVEITLYHDVDDQLNFADYIGTAEATPGSLDGYEVPADLEPGAGYIVRVESVDDPAVFGLSDSFEIIEGPSE